MKQRSLPRSTAAMRAHSPQVPGTAEGSCCVKLRQEPPLAATPIPVATRRQLPSYRQRLRGGWGRRRRRLATLVASGRCEDEVTDMSASNRLAGCCLLAGLLVVTLTAAVAWQALVTRALAQESYPTRLV